MTFSLEKSKAAFEEAKCYIPGGVNSPVRSFRAVGGTPPFIESAKGAKLYDIDGNEYIDYVLSWGPMILGHAHPNVIEALQGAVLRGTSYGAPTLYETALAKLISEMIPTMELVRMVNSGTEATMSVLRVARGFTGRSKIVKFEGCYHGHHDSLLVKAGSGAATFGVPDSPGVPAGVAQNTITVPYNDLEALEAVFKQDGNEIAAVIIEPVAGNMGLVLPKEGYLQSLRDLTKQYDILLIFDEVMCGFRCSLQGAQGLYGIEPDLTCLGKVIGGGLPVAAYGGRRDIMSCVSPAGPVYQAGTLSGNPLAMAAGFATLSLLKEQPELFDQMTESLTQLCAGMKREAEQYGLNYQFHQVGTMFCLFFTDQSVVNYDTAKTSDLEAFKVFFQAMLEQKIYLAPSQFETGFMSLAHSSEDIERTIKASGKAFAKVQQYLAAK